MCVCVGCGVWGLLCWFTDANARVPLAPGDMVGLVLGMVGLGGWETIFHALGLQTSVISMQSSGEGRCCQSLCTISDSSYLQHT